MRKKQGSVEWRRITGPQALAKHRGGLLLAAGCLMALGLIFLLEKLTPPTIVVGAFSFIPVLVAVWLLSGRLAAVVTIAAVLFRIGAIFLAGIHPLTIVAEVLAIGAIAGVGRFAAVAVSAYWAVEALADERERIARELHDGTIQALFAIGIGLRTTGARAPDSKLQKGITEAVGELDGVIRDLRNYVFGLRPLALSARPLGQALEELAHDLETKTSMHATTDVDHMLAAELAPKGGDVIQLAREALSNVSRHANARTCRLNLRRDGTTAILEIQDDGRGFNVSDVDGAGYGLVNMRERAAELGGNATVEAAPSRGTTVRITIPMTER